jgi:rhamnosyltransferase
MAETTFSLPRVLVCLAAYNGVRYLPEQMHSILSQEGVRVTVLASVDPCDDGTQAWLENLAAQDARVVVLPTGERFGGAAANFFRLLSDADMGAHDFLSFADQDDIWLPGKLRRAVDTLVQRGVDGYSSDVCAFWESGKSRYIRKSYPQRRWDYWFESAGPGCTFVMSRKLVEPLQRCVRQQRAALAEVGLHDWFSYAFARANGFAWYIDHHAGLMYRQHSGNQVGVNAGWAAFVWRARQVLNGWGLNQSRRIALLVGSAQDPFVRQWLAAGRWSALHLAWQAAQCRRKPVERVFFAVSCVALAVIGWRA